MIISEETTKILENDGLLEDSGDLSEFWFCREYSTLPEFWASNPACRSWSLSFIVGEGDFFPKPLSLNKVLIELLLLSHSMRSFRSQIDARRGSSVPLGRIPQQTLSKWILFVSVKTSLTRSLLNRRRLRSYSSDLSEWLERSGSPSLCLRTLRCRSVGD